MGCDIHLAVEKRNAQGQWERVHPPVHVRDPWLVQQAAERAQKADTDRNWYQRRSERVWYDDRNYDCFAILANVRNGAGFAGVEMGAGFVPISDPRGLPSDMSDAVRALNGGEDHPLYDPDDVWLGDHSHSWLTVADLASCDWSRVSRKCGVITAHAFVERVRAKETGEPKGYSGWISGPGIVVYQEDDASRRFFGPEAQQPTDREHVKVWWTETYAEAAGRFHSVVLPALVELAGEDPASVRIVFGFDS